MIPFPIIFWQKRRRREEKSAAKIHRQFCEVYGSINVTIKRGDIVRLDKRQTNIRRE